MIDRGNTPVPNAEIKIANKKFSMADVESVEVEEEINTAATCVIKSSIVDSEKGNWQFLDLKELNIGKAITISMGIDKAESVFKGEVTSLEPTFSNELSTIDIRGYDRLHRLGLVAKTRTFTNVKDSDLAAKIAGDWGLSSKTESTKTTFPYLYQHNQNDLEFLLQRGERIRYELGVDDKTLYFRKSKENSSPVVTLEFKVSFYEFSARLSSVYQGGKIQVQGWDVKKKALITASSSTSDKISSMGAQKTGDGITKQAFGKSSRFIVDEALVDAAEAKNIAAAQFNSSLVEAVVGEGHCLGNPLIRVGKTIELKGIGRFSGVYYVTSVTHRIDESGYNTYFAVRRTGI